MGTMKPLPALLPIKLVDSIPLQPYQLRVLGLVNRIYSVMNYDATSQAFLGPPLPQKEGRSTFKPV